LSLPTVKQKIHAHGWLILINALLAMLISTRYFQLLPEFPSELLAQIFMVASAWGQMTLLAALIGLVAIPSLFLPIIPRRGIQSLMASIGLITLFIDTIVFSQYRFHINVVVVNMIFAGQIVSFPLVTWVMVIVGVVLLFVFQWMIVRWLETIPIIMQQNLGKKFALLTLFALMTTHGIHIWGAANAYQPVTMMKRYLPLFEPATSNKLLRKYGWVNEEAIQRQKAMQVNKKSDLNYPLQPLNTVSIEKPVNIMLIVIDSWRFDTFGPDISPNIWSMTHNQNGVILSHHLSTGNSTRTGIFGLFYGVPGTYWHAFLANRQAPLLMDRLQDMGYELGIFSAAQLISPEFNQTVFANVPELRNGSKGSRPSELDANLTSDWINWYEGRDQSKPTFSFLFYDAPHGYDFPDDYSHRFEPMLDTINYLELNNDTDTTTFFNRYKTSVHYVDSLVNQVFDELKQSGDLDNTLVIITGDHGQELNDNKLNFWGHNGNFTNAQIQVPFMMFGPGVNADGVRWPQDMISSHGDVAPTIMKNYLGVSNDIKDYSTGENLLGKSIDRDWVLSASYGSYAVVTDKTILEVMNNGDYSYMDKTNRELNATLNYDQLNEALKQISRFSR
jgi:membrane-anchored protein YejM (alkaline phosphatase superfamily)